jgi:hypothetical protein
MDMQTALATFAACGRLVDPDPEAPIVLVNGEESMLSPARLITAATMMQHQGIVPPEASPLDECVDFPDPEPEWDRLREGTPDVDEESAMLEVDNIASDEADAGQAKESEVKHAMNFHICTDGRKKLAGRDGYCSKCRPVEEPVKPSLAPQEPTPAVSSCEAEPRSGSRRERIEAARSEKTIVLNWIDEGAMRQLTLGANVPETRSLAGRIQQARKHQNLEAMVNMVGSEHIAGTILASPKLFYKLVS